MEKTKKKFFPAFHLVKRERISFSKSLLIRAIGIFCALIFIGLVTMFVTGINPIDFYKTLIDGSIGTPRRFWSLLQNAAMLLCVAVALTPAFKMRFWNTGGEGQVLIGGMATAACMIQLSDKISGFPLMLIMFISASIAGAIWAGIPAFFKAKWDTNETLFTLMMNYVAIQIVSFFTLEWSVPKGSGQIGVINQQSRAGWMPYIGRNQYLLNILIVLVITLFIYFYLRQTRHGYELSVVGESMNTARYVGLDVPKVMIRTLLLSGALCGLAGFLIVSGADHTVAVNTAGGRGFTGILVSWLSKFNPLYMIANSLLLVFLERGALEISTIYRLNASYADIVTGIIIFFIIAFEFFINYKIMIRCEDLDSEASKAKFDSANFNNVENNEKGEEK